MFAKNMTAMIIPGATIWGHQVRDILLKALVKQQEYHEALLGNLKTCPEPLHTALKKQLDGVRQLLRHNEVEIMSILLIGAMLVK